MMSKLDALAKGIIGVTAPLAGLVTSVHQDIEWGLRCASLVVGILVGIATFVSLVRRKR